MLTIVTKLTGKLRRFIKAKILRDADAIEFRRWFTDRGDERLRLNYNDLNPESVVFDIGGYKGDFAYQINMKYDCLVYIFEPHPAYFAQCVERFASNPKVKVLNYGVSNQDSKLRLIESADGSSFHNDQLKHDNTVECYVREFFGVVKELEVTNIDLMKINIEGGEFPLLEHLSTLNNFNFVTNYQIQFHKFYPNAIASRNEITRILSMTHTRLWCYEFVWESWSLKHDGVGGKCRNE